ncbi:MAG: DUF6624 domain-containing protein [Pseudomonadota bacterium]
MRELMISSAIALALMGSYATAQDLSDGGRAAAACSGQMLSPYPDDLSDDAPMADKIAARLNRTAMEVAERSDTEDLCQAAFPEGATLFSSMIAGEREAFKRLGGYRPFLNKNVRAVQKEITRLWREDQAARNVMVRLGQDNEEPAKRWAHALSIKHAKSVDLESAAYMKEVLKTYDWIDRKRFGDSVSAHAWLLVQHADDDVEFQALALSRMEPYVATGGVRKRQYAYLWDRVAVNQGREQRYGTQPTWECDANRKMALRPLEDPENVNARRADMGLNTVEEGLAEMERAVCGVG